MQIKLTKISFPELRLHPHYGHKLRGFIGNLFKEESPLLHNHLENGKLRYAYPLVQYKIIDGVPTILGLKEGAELLIKLFLKINELLLDDLKIVIYSKNIINQNFQPSVSNDLLEYKFKTNWMALNPKNHKKYVKLLPGKERNDFLNRILVGNILSFYKGIGYTVEEKIYAKVIIKEKLSSFKNNKMTVFSGGFVTNAVLPDFVGLGKSVSRGFGAVLKSDSP